MHGRPYTRTTPPLTLVALGARHGTRDKKLLLRRRRPLISSCCCVSNTFAEVPAVQTLFLVARCGVDVVVANEKQLDWRGAAMGIVAGVTMKLRAGAVDENSSTVVVILPIAIIVHLALGLRPWLVVVRTTVAAGRSLSSMIILMSSGCTQQTVGEI